MELCRVNSKIILNDWGKYRVFNLEYWEDVQKLQEITKAGFDLALEHNYYRVDVDKMEVINIL
jgi:hypothetical protein